MAYNSYDLQNTSLVKTGSLTECYLPLWYYSSGTSNSMATSSAGVNFIQKGTYGTTSTINSAAKLHTLNSNWATTQKFSFEASILTSSGTITGYLGLWDVTSNSLVSGSQVSTTSSTATVVRSGQFALIPGHVYAITGWVSTSSYYVYVTKASLIAFLS